MPPSELAHALASPFCIRAAGVAFDVLDRLATPELAAAARRVNALAAELVASAANRGPGARRAASIAPAETRATADAMAMLSEFRTNLSLVPSPFWESIPTMSDDPYRHPIDAFLGHSLDRVLAGDRQHLHHVAWRERRPVHGERSTRRT